MRLSGPKPTAGAAATVACALALTVTARATPGTRADSSWTHVDSKVLDLALQAAACARATLSVARPDLLTVIDYSKPSTQPRLWVLDVAQQRVLFEELVAHGSGSGQNYAARFSNEPGSRQSSLGLFLTGATYLGRHGYSLRLDGLEPGINDRAFERAIVMHGAEYVRAGMGALMGRLGLSWGCPAIRESIARSMIDMIKAGSLIFAYYPDNGWLTSSAFLGSCTAGAARATTQH